MPRAPPGPPRLTTQRIHGEFAYVVRWPDGTSAWWPRRWQALAARAGWCPPLSAAYPVPGERFHYVWVSNEINEA
jgi:hypothetical protein